MDLSIIIPIYNTPPDILAMCFDSLKFSDAVTYEVVLVDDGSKAEVGDFCRDYVHNHREFRYIYKENGGVSTARNAGIRAASGEYILFADADDELLTDCMTPELFCSGYDIVFFDLLVREGSSQTHWKVFSETPAVYEKRVFVEAACRSRVNGTYARLYRRSLLTEKNLFFDETMVVAEDAKFVFQAILEAEQMFYVDAPAYVYHHSCENGDRRLRKYPRQVLENMMHHYRLKKDGLASRGECLGLKQDEIQALDTALDMRIVEDLFNDLGSLLISGGNGDFVKSAVLELPEMLHISNPERFELKTRIKYGLLQKNRLKMIALLAKARAVYQKVK